MDLSRALSIAAGVMLREAVRRSLYALAAQHGVLPARPYAHRSPMKLAQRLRQAVLLDDDQYQQIRQMIHVGNIAAHCGDIDPELLRDSICSLRLFVDRDPIPEIISCLAK